METWSENVFIETSDETRCDANTIGGEGLNRENAGFRVLGDNVVQCLRAMRVWSSMNVALLFQATGGSEVLNALSNAVSSTYASRSAFSVNESTAATAPPRSTR